MTKDEEKGYIERVLAGDESAYEPLVTEKPDKGIPSRAAHTEKRGRRRGRRAGRRFSRRTPSLADFRGDSRFSVWLYRLTNNICIDMLRKK